MKIQFDDDEERAIFARSLGLPADASDEDIPKQIALNVGSEKYDERWLTAAERRGIAAEIERRKRTAGL